MHLSNLLLSCCIFLVSTSGYFCKAVTEAFRNTHEATCETYPVPLRSNCEVVAVLLQSCRETAAEQPLARQLPKLLRCRYEAAAKVLRCCRGAVTQLLRSRPEPLANQLAKLLRRRYKALAEALRCVVKLLWSYCRIVPIYSRSSLRSSCGAATKLLRRCCDAVAKLS